MHLKLAIAGNVIASVPLNAAEATNLEYVFTQKGMLTEACAAMIVAQKDEPVYFIEVPSRMNGMLKK